MSELLGKFFGKEKQQGGKSRDKSPAMSDRTGTPTSAQSSASAADFCTYVHVYCIVSLSTDNNRYECCVN